MSLALREQNAWNEVFRFVAESNPAIGDDPTKWRPIKIEKNATDPMALKLIIASTQPDVVSGYLTVDYKAADLGKLVNVFGDVTKPPVVKFWSDAGTSRKLSDIINIMNNALGLQLNMSGLYTDLEDQTFTVPAKNGSVILTLTPKAIPVGGSSIMPLRLADSKKAVIEVFNRGSHIGTAMAKHAVNPYKTDTGELVWSGETQMVDDPTLSYLPLLSQLDFTDLFGTPQLLNAAFNAGNRDYGSGGWAAVMNDETRAIVNARLASVGIPPIDRPTNVVDSVTAYKNMIVSASSMTNPSANDTGTFVNLTKPFLGRHFSYFAISGDRGGALPAWIKGNVKKKYAIRIHPPGTTYTNGWDASLEDYNVAHDKKPMNKRPLYLFFNDLVV